MMCNNHFPTEYITKLKDQFGKIEVRYKKCENCGAYETENDQRIHKLQKQFCETQDQIDLTPLDKWWVLYSLYWRQNVVVRELKKLLGL